MISTFQALAVALLAILPGATYMFAFERVFGAYGVSLADRLVRFVAASAIFWASMSGLAVVAYKKVVTTGKLASGDVNPWLFEAVVLAYVLIPSFAGAWVGRAKKDKRKWAEVVAGESIEPRAWDYVWRPRTNALVRVKLKSGPWVAGLFTSNDDGTQSWAAGYPEEGDLFLSRAVVVDPETGEYQLDEGGRTMETGGGGLLLKWSEAEYMEVQHY